MAKTTSVLIVGVGGQGTLLASRILGEFAAEMGLECKLSEVHGMSQRGGSVVTHVRFGTEVNSPIVAEGDADYILAFEQLEAFRYRHFLKDEGTIIMNTQKIMPMPVILGTTFNMAHNQPEMNALISRLKAFDEPITILLEYTGHYHYPVLKKLQEEGFPVCVTSK